MYSKIIAEAAPRRQRRSFSRFEKTEEWLLMKADLEKGIAPGEALQVVLTERDKKNYGIRTLLSVVRFLKKYLSAQNLPYTVQSFRRQEGDYIIVRR
jgi:hypothetical protein